MLDTHQMNQVSYYVVGDIIVEALCIVLFIVLAQTFIYKNRHVNIIAVMIISMLTTTASNIVYQTLLVSESPNPVLLYISRTMHHVPMIVFCIMYIIYLQKPLWIPDKLQKYINSGLWMLLFAVTAADIIGTVTKKGFHVDENGIVHKGITSYMSAYVIIFVLIFYMIIVYRNRVIKQIFRGLLSINILSIVLLYIQGRYGQQSFTSASYFLLLLGIVFMFHSNPYDIDTGAVSDGFFLHEINECIEKKKPVIVISCTMVNFSKMLKESTDLKYQLYSFFRHNLKKGILYRFPGDKLVFTVPAYNDEEAMKNIDKMIADFRKLHAKFNMDYKIVLMKTTDKIDTDLDYVRIIEFIEHSMDANSVHLITELDIKDYYSSRYILSELEDIVKCRDMEDPRVLVYCQPVFNITNKTFDTAEALMRLKLDKTGLVYPDKFIPLAEQNGLIHTLSLIILNKTCKYVHELIDTGYVVQRISVNFSAIDMRYENFCTEVKGIISQHGIPFNKIAVEITESRSESDFNLMKQRVDELREVGIKFYLDDFGTGYSNFDRIMEIPFDIIKFDRSLLVESGKSDSSEFMVYTFANMFTKLNYSVLFEGVEDENDEDHCVKMKADYLQGYKYSKPIPIEKLVDFFEFAGPANVK